MVNEFDVIAYPPSAQPWLQDLNPEQREAVTMAPGAICILAGAGTGKTKTLTARVSHLLNTQSESQRLMVVTFTNKAAHELRDRLRGLIPDIDHQGHWIGTFHGLSLRALRSYPDVLSLESGFTVIDAADQRRVLKDILKTHGTTGTDLDLATALRQIERWKDQCWLPWQVPSNLHFGRHDQSLRTVYRQYQSDLIANNVADFSDLICGAVRLLEEDSERAGRLRCAFAHVLVDEFQDTNLAQYRWVRGFASHSGSLCVVGDDDQSIYGWRGAEVKNFKRMHKDFKDVHQVVLSRNYRSRQGILQAASSLVAHNTSRIAKTLTCARDLHDRAQEPLSVYYCLSDYAEAAVVANRCLALQSQGVALEDIGILVRANAMLRLLEEACLHSKIPYHIRGSLRFYEREETRDVLAYFRLIARPRDDLAFMRIVNKPNRGIGDALQSVIQKTAQERGCSCEMASREMQARQELSARQQKALTQFLHLLDRLRDAQMTADSMAEFATAVINETGLLAKWQSTTTLDAATRVDNLKDIPSAVQAFESLEQFLEHVELVFDIQDNSTQKSQAVQLMTIHAAKGLEFDHVFLPGWSDGLFPIIADDFGDAPEDTLDRLEEERRLAYVAVTRARQTVSFFHAARRVVFGKTEFFRPSRFLEEIDSTCLQHYQVNGATPNVTRHGPTPEAQQSQPRSVRYQNKAHSDHQSPIAAPRTRPVPRHMHHRFHAGDRCLSDRYGKGTIIAVKGSHLLQIQFDDFATTLTIAGGFVQPLTDEGP